jgi:hypothetical protein
MKKRTCDFFQKYPDLLVDFSGLIFEAEDSGYFNNISATGSISILCHI